MTTHLSPELLLQVSERIAAAVGLQFPPERLRELDRKIRLAARELAFLDTEAFARWILSSPLADDQIRMLAGHLSLKETYFFREPLIWEILQNVILPPLIANREGTDQRLRFWNAFCSTGEDAYSIAITLAQAALPNRQEWRCIILATDMSSDALRCAQSGIYSPWSFRGTSPEIRARYFRPLSNGQFAIRPEIRKMVTFVEASLIGSHHIPNSGLMDVIFCRNVLFYLTPDRIGHVLKRFHDTLVDGGWLIVGAEDTAYFSTSPFVPVVIQGVTLYRKNRRLPRVSILFSAKSSSSSTSSFASLTSSSSLPDSPLPSRLSPLPLFGRGSNELHDSLLQKQQPAGSEATTLQAETQYEQAHAFYTQGQYEHVIALLLPHCHTLESTAHSVVDTQECALLARAYSKQERFTDAQHWCEFALQRDPENPKLHYLRATIFLAQERHTDAIEALHTALSLHPHFVLAHFTLGNLLQQQYRHEEALHHLTQALTILQESPYDEVVPESEGITAGKMIELMNVMIQE